MTRIYELMAKNAPLRAKRAAMVEKKILLEKIDIDNEELDRMYEVLIKDISRIEKIITKISEEFRTLLVDERKNLSAAAHKNIYNAFHATEDQ